MAKIDEQKEKIGFLKMFFFFILGSLFTLIAYIFNNFDTLYKHNIKFIFVNISIVLLSFLLIYLSFKLKKEMKILREL